VALLDMEEKSKAIWKKIIRSSRRRRSTTTRSSIDLALIWKPIDPRLATMILLELDLVLTRSPERPANQNQTSKLDWLRQLFNRIKSRTDLTCISREATF
jgi:hypothetical protein